jgi:hypothetical protein
MPIHDWTKVEAGIFQGFHHGWITSICGMLNRDLLPSDYYSLPERVTPGFGLDVPILQKKSLIAIRHVSRDRLVAIIEIVSPENKASPQTVRSFVQKTCELSENHIHFLIVDLFPSGPYNPNGVHGLIWQEMKSMPPILPREKPLTLVSYECEQATEAYLEPIAVGDVLPNMPLFLEAKRYIMVPLENTYMTAFEAFPRRWRDVLQLSGR